MINPAKSKLSNPQTKPDNPYRIKGQKARGKIFLFYFSLLLILLLVAGCGGKQESFSFTAQIENVTDNTLLVSTLDEVGFYKTAVNLSTKIDTPSGLSPKQFVEIEAAVLDKGQDSNKITPLKITRIEAPTPAPSYTKISSAKAQEIMEYDAIILDVRTLDEFEEGHIPGALLLPNNQILAQAEKMLPDKDAIILVYCRSGNRSASASKDLLYLGYTKVYDFGGINSWLGEIVVP